MPVVRAMVRCLPGLDRVIVSQDGSKEGRKMDWMIASGTISPGVLVGILVGYFVNEAKKDGPNNIEECDQYTRGRWCGGDV